MGRVGGHLRFVASWRHSHAAYKWNLGLGQGRTRVTHCQSLVPRRCVKPGLGEMEKQREKRSRTRRKPSMATPSPFPLPPFLLSYCLPTSHFSSSSLFTPSFLSPSPTPDSFTLFLLPSSLRVPSHPLSFPLLFLLFSLPLPSLPPPSLPSSLPLLPPFFLCYWDQTQQEPQYYTVPPASL